MTANGDSVSTWSDEKNLELDSGDGCDKIVSLLPAAELYTLVTM